MGIVEQVFEIVRDDYPNSPIRAARRVVCIRTKITRLDEQNPCQMYPSIAHDRIERCVHTAI